MLSINPFSLLITFTTSFIATFIFIPVFIKFLRRTSSTQAINTYLNSVGNHINKSSTPTMGGLVIMACSYFSFLLFFGKHLDLTTVAILILGFCFGLLGFFDDWIKVTSRKHFGLLIKFRFTAELILALLFILIIHYEKGNDPSFKYYMTLRSYSFHIGSLYFLIKILAIIGTANGVNITDGLDGLVSFPLFLCYLFMSFLGALLFSHQFGFHSYSHCSNGLLISGLCISVCGSILGFLWHNANPAKIFMGDVGSLGIGGMLGAIAVAMKTELLLITIGIVFVINTTSCIIQIFSFRLFGKRVFLMAPIHHHFEKKGISETTIVTRMWIISIIGIAIGLILI